jgi:hypothetical protein
LGLRPPNIAVIKIKPKFVMEKALRNAVEISDKITEKWFVKYILGLQVIFSNFQALDDAMTFPPPPPPPYSLLPP